MILIGNAVTVYKEISKFVICVEFDKIVIIIDNNNSINVIT